SFMEDDYIELRECLNSKRKILLQTHRKNIDLDLLKRYTTLFAIRYLFDGGIDKCFSFINNALKNLPYQLKHLTNDWFIIKNTFDPEDINEVQNECISNIILKKRIPKKKIKENFSNDFTFQNNGTDTQYCLHISDVITIASEEKGNSFAILRLVFSHKKNNQYFVFIIINEFELTSQK
ncbi:31456_t:CDS:2, partial [Gigaspora margarita]